MITDNDIRVGEKLYLNWATCGGTFTSPIPFDDLPEQDRQRWLFAAKAWGEPKHHHLIPTPDDVLRSGGESHLRTQVEPPPDPPQLDCFEYDAVLTAQGVDHLGRKIATPGGRPIPSGAMNYAEWVAHWQDRLSWSHWWWRPWSRPTLDLSDQGYREYLDALLNPPESPTAGL